MAVEVRISGVLGIGRGNVREMTGWDRGDWGSIRVGMSVGRDWEEWLPSRELKTEWRSGGRNVSCFSDCRGLLGTFEAEYASVNQWADRSARYGNQSRMR
jgi:hypothetical protein